MFVRSFKSKDRSGNKVTKPPTAASSKRLSFIGNNANKQRLLESLEEKSAMPLGKGLPPRPSSAVITLVVGPNQRLFAAHEDVLLRSPVFDRECRNLFLSGDSRATTQNRMISLPTEDPETFSCVLEYLYRGDYTPRLLQSKTRGWQLDSTDIGAGGQSKNPNPMSSTINHISLNGLPILRDTAVYCAAVSYSLPELQRLALRKQGLQSGVDVGTILRSMRFAYARTGESESKLRAHFLALIVRARRTFVRSGTMQREMETGGTMFFDLFVALCNHLDDVSAANTSPRTV